MPCSVQIKAVPAANRRPFGNIVGGVITRLVSAILLEQPDQGVVHRSRYISLESIAPISDDPLVGLPTLAA
jgi:hypothetical protein